ncbi:MAG: PilZ domain-containing protein [Phycisphaerales bacterium]
MIRDGRIFEPRPTGADRRERRLFPRWPIARACKLRRIEALRFRAATTADVSASGARLLLDDAGGLEVGLAVEIAVAWDARPTIPHGETIRGRVVRLTHEPGECRAAVAVAFDRPIALETIIPADRAA